MAVETPRTPGGATGPCVLGVDGGTEGVRVGVFDLVGTPLAFAAEPYGLRHPRPGWAEQDPDEWWSAFVTATRRAVAESGVEPSAVRALSVATTGCTVVALDAQDRPLRPAILWMDVRAVAEARRVAESEHPVRRVNGFGSVSAEWFPCKALWIKAHQPEVWEQAAHVVEYADWLMHRLSGEWTGSVNSASVRAYYDRAHGGWPVDFYAELGLEDLMAKLPQDMRVLGAPVATIAPAAAEALGLSRDTVVAQGGGDAFVAQAGLDVLAPGRMALITGSSHLHLGQAAEEVSGPGFFGGYADAVVPGQWTVEGGQISTGSVVSWFARSFAGDLRAEAARRGIGLYDLLNEQAAEIPLGSDGLIVLDYWQGNRTPYVDPEARGMIWGLTLSHGPQHVYRAILEGICYGTEHTLRAMRSAGYQVERLVACGGALHSPDWVQMHADVTGLPITLTRVQDAVCLGSAVLAAAGAGLHPSVAEAARAMVHETETLEPDRERHAAYAFFAQRYIETYPRMRELVHDVVREVSRRGRGRGRRLMLAAVFHGPGELRVEEVPTPEIADDEVLVRVGANTICGTDVRVLNGEKTSRIRRPSIIGHEIAGHIAAVGDRVEGYTLGAAVGMAPVIPCRHCWCCTHGLENVCTNQRIMGYEIDGGLGEYVRIPADAVAAGNLFEAHGTLGPEHLALAEPLSCVVNGQRRSGVGLDDSVLIMGAGPIGLLHLQLARLSGARPVVVSEPNPARREQARRLGADLVLDPSQEELAVAVAELTHGVGVDRVIICIGRPELVDEAFALARKGGNVNLFAGFAGTGRMEASANLIHYQGARGHRHVELAPLGLRRRAAAHRLGAHQRRVARDAPLRARRCPRRLRGGHERGGGQGPVMPGGVRGDALAEDTAARTAAAAGPEFELGLAAATLAATTAGVPEPGGTLA